MGTSGAVCRRIGRPFPPTAEFAPSSRWLEAARTAPCSSTDRQASAIRSANKKKSGTLRCDGENAAAGRRRTGRPSALFWDPGSIAPRRRHIGVPSPPTAEFAPSSRRAKRGGPTLRSVIYGGSLVGFPGSRHRSHQKPLHVLIGSPSTIFERGCLETQFSGSPGRSHLAAVTSVFHPRRRQNSPRAPDAPQAALAHQ